MLEGSVHQSGNHVRVNAQLIGAENDFETVIASDRNSVLAFAALGWCKFLTGSIEEAISLQEQAIRLSPLDPYIGNWYGRIGLVHLVYGGRTRRSCACPGRAKPARHDACRTGHFAVRPGSGQSPYRRRRSDHPRLPLSRRHASGPSRGRRCPSRKLCRRSAQPISTTAVAARIKAATRRSDSYGTP